MLDSNKRGGSDRGLVTFFSANSSQAGQRIQERSTRVQEAPSHTLAIPQVALRVSGGLEFLCDPDQHPKEQRTSELLTTRPKTTFQWPPDCLWPFIDRGWDSET
jgi:hypothetical protein